MAATARLDFPPAGEPASRIDRLRRQLCALEAATGLAAAREAETAAASGFALALAARRTSLRGAPPISGLPAIGSRARARNDESAASVLTPGRHVLWIAEDLSLAENGAPYG